MVNSDGRAVLADFGFVNFAPNRFIFLAACMEAGTVRWMSPELFDPQKYGSSGIQPTKESDCYALGMVAYEILSGSTPFGTDNSFAVLRRVLEGERPERPEGDAAKLFTDSIWGVMKRCWKDKPKERASARDVLQCLGEDPDAEGEADDPWDAAFIDPQGDELCTSESDAGRFSPFNLGAVVNHPCGILDPPPALYESGMSIPPPDSPCRPSSPVMPCHFPDPPKAGSSNMGWLGDRFRRNVFAGILPPPLAGQVATRNIDASCTSRTPRNM